MTEKRILVTGATGMMGRAVARRLASTHRVFGVARFGDAAIRRSLENAGVECIPFDLCVDDLSALPGGIQVLMHFAVSWNCTPEAFAPALAFNGFLIGRMLDRWPDLEQFVLGSTVAVYTGAGRYDLTENSPTVPGTVYGTTKLAGDVIACSIAQRRHLPGAILRYWFPYTDEPGVASDSYQALVRRLAEGKPFRLSRDFAGCQQPLFIDDLVRITVDSLRFADPAPFLLNVSGPERLTLREVVTTLGEVFSTAPVIEEGGQESINLISGSYDLTRLETTCGGGGVLFRQGLQRLRQNMPDRGR